MAEPEGSDKKSRNGVATGVALGLVLGAGVGMLVFDNLALGGGIGLLVGIVVGAAFDARSRNDEPR